MKPDPFLESQTGEALSRAEWRQLITSMCRFLLVVVLVLAVLVGICVALVWIGWHYDRTHVPL
jgi:hypothetical protein